MIAAVARIRAALGSPARSRGILAVEAVVGLGAILLLLSQIACVSQTPLDFAPGSVHLTDATFVPAFVDDRASLPARVRYWVAPAPPVSVTWPEIRFGQSCNFCLPQDSCPTGRFTVPPATSVTVNHRRIDSDMLVEDARFSISSGCAGTSDPPTFAPSETGDYLAHVSYPDLPPVPSQPGTSVRFNVLSSKFTLPPRLMQPGAASDEWLWSGIRDSTTVKEAFDPRLHVSKVRVLVGTCAVPPMEGRGDECGGDLLMDPAFTLQRVIAPQYVRVRSQGVPVQDCHGEASAPDGAVDLGPDPANNRASLCRPNHNLVFVTPNYRSDEPQAGATLTWRVVFSAEDGFPLPSAGEQVWIEFTLVPAP